MIRVLAVVLLCGCVHKEQRQLNREYRQAQREYKREHRPQLREQARRHREWSKQYAKKKQAYHECVAAFREKHAEEIETCENRGRAWRACERRHYEAYPHHERKTCPGAADIFGQIYELIHGVPDDCGYSQVPEYREGEPHVVEDCGGEPPFSCVDWTCEQPRAVCRSGDD